MVRDDRSAWVEENGKRVLPRISLIGQIIDDHCWSTLPYTVPSDRCARVFLDWNYVYDPRSFGSMSGKSWAVFRKNAKKWPRRHTYFSWTSDPAPIDDLIPLIDSWTGGREIVHDDEALWAYLHRSKEQRSLYSAGALVAWLAWDTNFWGTNFRWLIVRRDMPFLDEYCRWYFYTNICDPSKLVNDGGALGSKGLERMKDKMNPVRKIPIYTWEAVE